MLTIYWEVDGVSGSSRVASMSEWVDRFARFGYQLVAIL